MIRGLEFQPHPLTSGNGRGTGDRVQSLINTSKATVFFLYVQCLNYLFTKPMKLFLVLLDILPFSVPLSFPESQTKSGDNLTASGPKELWNNWQPAAHILPARYLK